MEEVNHTHYVSRCHSPSLHILKEIMNGVCYSGNVFPLCEREPLFHNL